VPYQPVFHHLTSSLVGVSKLSRRLENGASAASILLHHNATPKNLAFLFGFLYITFGLSENLLSNG